MLPQEIIRKKRDGQTLTSIEIQSFIAGITTHTISDAQIAAFCMAVLLNKMNLDERIALTTAMAQSGTQIDWSHEHLNGPLLDKHSTGGIGDKISLMLAPIIAACGGFVPMIAGHGLGHTGGTLDKLDAIPGYMTKPDLVQFKNTVKQSGCAIVAASPLLAPADRIIYAIRDVTGTVESQDLITASILSKKLAAGLNGLVLDVKVGNGAFMENDADALALAKSIVDVANRANLPTVALLTDMNQPLGFTAGNAVEVQEAIDFLNNKNIEPRLQAATLALSAELLVLGHLAKDIAEAQIKINTALNTGLAAEHFARMVHQLGGPIDLMDKPEHYLKAAPIIRDYFSPIKGILTATNARAIGIGLIEMGAGRKNKTDSIDHRVGLTQIAHIGDDLNSKPLATIHAKDEASFHHMARVLSDAITVDGEIMNHTLIKTKVSS